MGRGPSRFRPSDVTRAVKAVVAAGVEVGRIEVDKEGRIVIIAGKGDPELLANDLDAWISKHARAA